VIANTLVNSNLTGVTRQCV